MSLGAVILVKSLEMPMWTMRVHVEVAEYRGGFSTSAVLPCIVDTTDRRAVGCTCRLSNSFNDHDSLVHAEALVLCQTAPLIHKVLFTAENYSPQ